MKANSRVRKSIVKSQTKNSQLEALAVYNTEKSKPDGKGIRKIVAEFNTIKIGFPRTILCSNKNAEKNEKCFFCRNEATQNQFINSR